MEHKVKKVAKSDATGNTRRQPMGKGHENASQTVGERQCREKRLGRNPMGKMGTVRINSQSLEDTQVGYTSH